MRNLILAVVTAAALVGCPQPAKTETTHAEYRPNTVYSKVVGPDGVETTYVTFRPYSSNARLACTYAKGWPNNVSCSNY